MRTKSVIVAVTVGILLSVLVSSDAQAQKPAYLVGTAKVSIAPTFPYPDGTIYVGGVIPGPLRPGDGNAADTLARAVAISAGDDPRGGVVLVEIDIQGAFAAVKQGPYGLDDVQNTVAGELGINPAQIIIGSSHTHAGADIMGIWGGSPTSYLKQVHDATEQAIREAWNHRRAARLSWASIPAPELLLNQSNWQGMDDELRVLVASNPKSGAPIAVLPNWQAHPSLVPGNELHPDWVGILDDMVEAEYPGAFGMAFVGAVGHTQSTMGSNTDEATGIQRATDYSTLVRQKLDEALKNSHPIAATGVSIAQVFYKETAVGPNALVLEYANADRAVDLYRSTQPPWLSDTNVVGTQSWTVRIGDIVLGAAPGEAYAWIHFSLKDTVRRETFFMGLAGDTLGYLVAPSEDIPKFATDGDDNLALLISPTMGDHTMCALVTGATAIGVAATVPPARCAQWLNDTTVVVKRK